MEGDHVLTLGTLWQPFSQLFELGFASDKVFLVDSWGAAQSQAQIIVWCHIFASSMLRAADRYAYTGCGSTAYSIGTIYGGKEIYILLMLALLCWRRPVASLATPRRFTGDALSPCSPCTPRWRRPARRLRQTLSGE
jgi:hypothetical protein